MRIFNSTRKITICTKTEIANTTFKRSVGLMFRKSLPKNTGLLMVFEKERKAGIWMLGMRFPIDIVFLGARKQVITVTRNAQPFSLNPSTWHVYYPQKPAKYMLELNAGAAQGTHKGDRLTI
jgi:uncharacterized membrane protein (UPF0127 family)